MNRFQTLLLISTCAAKQRVSLMAGPHTAGATHCWRHTQLAPHTAVTTHRCYHTQMFISHLHQSLTSVTQLHTAVIVHHTQRSQHTSCHHITTHSCRHEPLSTRLSPHTAGISSTYTSTFTTHSCRREPHSCICQALLSGGAPPHLHLTPSRPRPHRVQHLRMAGRCRLTPG